ncbi:3-hydroxyacyl-CoA dehydrogenase NAD-binding domain-containing protein [Burkholderia vietnamiensis]|uniref:3-hydroxyacyl-CoA dehydrogenase NAD-binding domain-containing protein n=1 Tax=Burkholderia vietnamiensis TaxID=60552 RepID=A0AAW7SZN3_BURVI|nr:3-hydroxyacyl-CoA dehydrogenase NAD-binding domain-containing protein [Burkholderia vietnamiensis]MBH9645848.1 enoyl-CoA hydratase/isomerase family protein [Burkholderia vietnamiensis]MBR8008843.1 enoyl-CoA hydratase/isomerase family protein [Burkholderia vietnamiensis]MDN7551299.1 3-hydroxyacyl-CoA dehydrogenase NAD-binding domain-containing protein [Burkholderia vietnamiensis]MDN7795113.1 3-hydroxyacyl-CoA dehydrogenase NAD-binding domain-containing protein [Burkholderia vietnamiensis]MDN
MTAAVDHVDGFALSERLDDDGILTITIDMPGRSQNVLNQSLMDQLGASIERIASDSSIRGAILASGKRDFIAGGDIETLYSLSTASDAFEMARRLQHLTRRIETQGKPVVAAVAGTALGGGLEIILACHHRIAVKQARAKYGLPEVKLGLLPGGGGTQRLPRLIGLKDALPLMLEGKDIGVEQAIDLGIFQELADDTDDMLSRARAWILSNATAQQPWDAKGWKIPGGNAQHPSNLQMVVAAPGMLRNKTKGNFPAPLNILSAAVEGSMVDIDNGLKIEARYFAALATHQVTKNILTSTWFQLNSVNKGKSRPEGVEKRPVRKLGVIGAGMMGAGIAYVAARAGIDVVLKDVTLQAAEQGKGYAERRVAESVKRGRSTEDENAQLLARIHPTESIGDLAGCDYVIEAVFEDRALKAKVTKEAEHVMAPSGIFGSNTSTLPITGLAAESVRPAQFIGIHFFSPVEKMPLVEIIVGRDTSAETLAHTFDLVQQLKKTPIVVNDARGFYTTRVFSTYVREGLAMLGEGQSGALIENTGIAAGMPVGPLALADELSLDLMLHVTKQAKTDSVAEGREYVTQPHEAVVDHMAHRCQRMGKKHGKGFYEYPEGGKKYLWPGLSEQFPRRVALAQCDLADRLIFIQALETVRCVEEGVIKSTADANIGSMLGWGFAPHLGGTLQAITAYGLPAFVVRARELAEKYGDRFSPPKLLLTMADEGRTF